jgi:hypothetical protein
MEVLLPAMGLRAVLKNSFLSFEAEEEADERLVAAGSSCRFRSADSKPQAAMMRKASHPSISIQTPTETDFSIDPRVVMLPLPPVSTTPMAGLAKAAPAQAPALGPDPGVEEELQRSGTDEEKARVAAASWTAKLLHKGVEKCAQKVGEEATEEEPNTTGSSQRTCPRQKQRDATRRGQRPPPRKASAAQHKSGGEVHAHEPADSMALQRLRQHGTAIMANIAQPPRSQPNRPMRRGSI